MAGILHNKQESSEEKAFTRASVLENTKLNSQVGTQGEELRRKLASQKNCDQNNKYPKTKAPPSSLRFDEEEIEEYDKIRGRHQQITEPKTPYTGTAETTEYYDNEDVPEPDELDLGEAANDEDVL